MAKLIVTNSHDDYTNILIELKDGSQIELDVDWYELITALKESGQTIVTDVIQQQPTK